MLTLQIIAEYDVLKTKQKQSNFKSGAPCEIPCIIIITSDHPARPIRPLVFLETCIPTMCCHNNNNNLYFCQITPVKFSL